MKSTFMLLLATYASTKKSGFLESHHEPAPAPKPAPKLVEKLEDIDVPLNVFDALDDVTFDRLIYHSLNRRYHSYRNRQAIPWTTSPLSSEDNLYM